MEGRRRSGLCHNGTQQRFVCILQCSIQQVCSGGNSCRVMQVQTSRIQVQAPKRQVQTPKNTSPDTQNTSLDTQNTSPDTPNTYFRVYSVYGHIYPYIWAYIAYIRAYMAIYIYIYIYIYGPCVGYATTALVEI